MYAHPLQALPPPHYTVPCISHNIPVYACVCVCMYEYTCLCVCVCLHKCVWAYI